MPDELTPFAVELITRCPQLINLFADKINSMLGDWVMDRLKPIKLDSPLPCDIQDLISHVGYDAAQCGYDK